LRFSAKRDGFSDIIITKSQAHTFFATGEPTWELIEAGEGCILPFEKAKMGEDRDCCFFHTEFTSEDVREFIPPVKAPFELPGFTTVPDSSVERFISDEPIMVVEKITPADAQSKEKGPEKRTREKSKE